MHKFKIVSLDSDSLGNDMDWSAYYLAGEFVSYGDTLPEQVHNRIKDADIVLTNKVELGEAEFAAAPNIKLVVVFATGYNQIDIKAASKRNILVCNVKDYSTPSVAQHIFALMLDLAGAITLHANAVAEGEWSRATSFCFWKKPTYELAGKTLGIIGFGSIGSAVAKIGNAFGLRIIAYSPSPKPKPDYAPFEFASIDELLACSDFVSLNCPLNEQTKCMVDMQFLSKMKASAFLINGSRGGLINEKDLRKALEDGIIAGAGVDVVVDEPMPNCNPLFGAPNCIITPHMAWATYEARTRLMQGVLDNVKNFIAGKPSNVVN